MLQVRLQLRRLHKPLLEGLVWWMVVRDFPFSVLQPGAWRELEFTEFCLRSLFCFQKLGAEKHCVPVVVNVCYELVPVRYFELRLVVGDVGTTRWESLSVFQKFASCRPASGSPFQHFLTPPCKLSILDPPHTHSLTQLSCPITVPAYPSPSYQTKLDTKP